MRVNLSNAISFKVEYEKLGGGWCKGFNAQGTYRYDSNSDKWYVKPKIEVDFGTCKRTLIFDNDWEMENFIDKFLPEEYEGATIID